jgi:hypothetical protein
MINILSMFHHQFKATAGHNNWTPCQKRGGGGKERKGKEKKRRSAHVLCNLQGQAAMFYTVSPLKQQETTEALESCYGAHHLATEYHSQLKARTQLVGESLQEFATTVEQLTHGALPGLPKN